MRLLLLLLSLAGSAQAQGTKESCKAKNYQGGDCEPLVQRFNDEVKQITSAILLHHTTHADGNKKLQAYIDDPLMPQWTKDQAKMGLRASRKHVCHQK